jgi:hypothetical protein
MMTIIGIYPNASSNILPQTQIWSMNAFLADCADECRRSPQINSGCIYHPRKVTILICVHLRGMYFFMINGQHLFVVPVKMKKLKKYIRTRLHHLELRLREYAESEETETLHEVRVEIKKIKAFLFAAGKTVKGFHRHKEFLAFRDIFRQAEDIRQPEVQADLAAGHHVSLDQRAKVNEDKQKDLFRLETPGFIRRFHQKKRELMSAAKKVSKKSFHKVLEKLSKTIKQALSPRVVQSQLHKTRKKMKNVLYLDKAQHVLSTDKKKFFMKIEELIGGYHDKQLLLASLSGTDRKSTMNIRSHLKQDLARIRKATKEFYSST